MNPLQSPELHTLAEHFLWNADTALADSSPLYEKLARRAAQDPEILALAAHAQPHQPAVNLLFSSVHYLLMRRAAAANGQTHRFESEGAEDDDADVLASFFPDLTPEPNVTDDPYPSFRAFCLTHANEIVSLVSTRRVQTNEVARCALFLPAFTLISERLEGEPLALVEVGSSAGLNLNWDRYAYRYGSERLYGDALSPVVLNCALRGNVRPPLPENLPRAASRVGIDLNPNDVFDEDAMLWLRALVWPEQLDRADRLQKAIALARKYPPRPLQGDAIELAPRVIQETPRDTPIVLFHSFVLNQVPEELRTRYYDSLAEESEGRVLYDAAIEPSAWPAPLVLHTFRNGEPIQEILASCDHHGRWLEWINNDTPL